MKLNRHDFAEFFRTDFYTVQVIFVDNVYPSPKPPGESKKRYTYKVPKNLKVEIGDSLLVCKHEVSEVAALNVVQVVSINLEPEIDGDAPFNYKWVVDRLDSVLVKYNENIGKDNRLKKAVAKLENALQRVSLRKQLEAAFQEIPDEDKAELVSLFGADIFPDKALTNGSKEEKQG